jgi:hypothetical protein
LTDDNGYGNLKRIYQNKKEKHMFDFFKKKKDQPAVDQTAATTDAASSPAPAEPAVTGGVTDGAGAPAQPEMPSAPSEPAAPAEEQTPPQPPTQPM